MGRFFTARVDANIGGRPAIDGLFMRGHRLQRCGLAAYWTCNLNQDLVW